jgi:hypothetical protein
MFLPQDLAHRRHSASRVPPAARPISRAAWARGTRGPGCHGREEIVVEIRPPSRDATTRADQWPGRSASPPMNPDYSLASCGWVPDVPDVRRVPPPAHLFVVQGCSEILTISPTPAARAQADSTSSPGRRQTAGCRLTWLSEHGLSIGMRQPSPPAQLHSAVNAHHRSVGFSAPLPPRGAAAAGVSRPGPNGQAPPATRSTLANPASCSARRSNSRLKFACRPAPGTCRSAAAPGPHPRGRSARRLRRIVQRDRGPA